MKDRIWADKKFRTLDLQGLFLLITLDLRQLNLIIESRSKMRFSLIEKKLMIEIGKKSFDHLYRPNKGKKQSRRSKILHLVWQITRKTLKIKVYKRSCRSTLYPISSSC